MHDATRTLTSAYAERYTLPKFRLRILSGARAGLERVFDKRLCYVGSAPDNDLVLDDMSVSRTHLKLEGERAGYRLLDLGSKNGTWLGPNRIVEALLTASTQLRLGQTEVAFQLLDEMHEVALSREPRFGSLLGQSPQMREIFALLARVAPTDVTVLIYGESGTGKELVADALHSHSARSNGPMVIFDCSAVQASLMESELFGHVRGAFTGAVVSRQGAMAEADGGTLFLDEVGELSLEMQPKLLRALENREIRPVGSNDRRRVDVRIIAATNRDLKQMVKDRSFREDLYYRLNVVPIRLPALRQRRDDIPLLVHHFLADAQRSSKNQRAFTVSFDTMQRLREYHWQGNVRELRNYIERASVLSIGEELEIELEDGVTASEQADHGGLPVFYELPFKDAKARLVDAFEREYWQRALTESGWNISAAARATGLHRKSLEYLIRKLDLKRPVTG